VLLATPDGRAFMQESLRRMRDHEALISAQLTRHGLPLELLAVPLVESGYRNLPASGDPRHGAGLWMFVAPTARHFGLAVNAARDDRLGVATETGAAIRLLTGLHAQFGDWRLALLAYNTGSVRVEEGMRKAASRDAWALVSRGYENDPDYLARVMAAMIVLKNPGVSD
jgi:membrane-bound lytic murein transglycosylase D